MFTEPVFPNVGITGQNAMNIIVRPLMTIIFRSDTVEPCDNFILILTISIVIENFSDDIGLIFIDPDTQIIILIISNIDSL